MGSFVGYCPLHIHSFSKCLQPQAQGGILPFTIPAPSVRLKKKVRRRVLASYADGEMDSLGNMKERENSCTNRRAMLALFAFSASPIFAPWSIADEDPGTDKKDTMLSGASSSQKPEIVDTNFASQEQNVAPEFSGQDKSPVSTFFAFLNELGIVGSGVLGALYALERKEKDAAESTAEAVAAELKEKKIAMESLRENLEGKIQEEQDKRLEEAKKAQEGQAILSKELASANLVVTDLQKQLEGEKKMVLSLAERVEKLNAEITRVEKDNMTLETKSKEKQSRITGLEEKTKLANADIQVKEKEIQGLKVSLGEREKELAELSSKVNHMRKALLHADSQVEELKRESAIVKHDLGLKESSLKDLSERLASAVVEREDAKKKLFVMHEELNQMQLSFDGELASARQALFAKEEEANQLKEKLDIALEEAKRNAGILKHLQEENANLNVLLEKEKASVKHLSGQLQRSAESLEASRSKIATLSSELTASKQMQAQLHSEMKRLQIDRDAMCTALEQRLHEAELTSSELSNELASVNKALDTSRNEQLLLNKKLKDSIASYENLKGELSQVRKTAEASIAALNEEKKVVAALSQKLEASERSLLEEKEDTRVLQRDFEEAAKSVEDLRSCLMSLSEESELAKSRIDTLELEKASLYESLKAQKQLGTEVQESAEHTNKALTKLGKEKETSVKRARKLEEELSSAKGEILRLRKHITEMNAALEEAQLQKENESQSEQSHGTASSPADVSLQIESMQAELYRIQKKLANADPTQVESEVATNSLQDVVSQDHLIEDTLLVAPISTLDLD